MWCLWGEEGRAAFVFMLAFPMEESHDNVNVA